MITPHESRRRQTRLNRLFQFFGCPEGDLLAGLDLDGFSSPRISTHASRTILNRAVAVGGAVKIAVDLSNLRGV